MEAKVDDGLLTKALQEGSIKAYEMIFRELYPTLCTYAAGLLRNRSDAEDLVQNIFVHVWEVRLKLQINTSLKAYFYRSVRNACLNKLKHQIVVQQHHEFAQHNLSPAGSGTIEQLQANELSQRIESALRELPEQCRLVFSMSRFEELKYAEIADHLGISVKTVENHMGKALRLMRQHLGEFLTVAVCAIKYLFDFAEWMN